MTIRALLRTGAALGALVAVVSMAPAAANAQEFEVDVRHAFGYAAVSGNGDYYALIEGPSGDPNQALTVRGVDSNEVVAEFARPDDRFFHGRPQISRDGSTVVVTACEWHVASGTPTCSLYRADPDTEELTELAGVDETAIPAGSVPVPYVLTPDATGIYFANFRRYDLALDTMFSIVMGADLCTDEMAAPYDFRECTLEPAGSGGAWLLIEANDYSGQRDAAESPVRERTTGYIVEAETGSDEQVFQVNDPDFAELIAATHDGSKVFFSRQAESGSMAYYLWDRDAEAEPQRLDRLPGGSIPPSQTQLMSSPSGDMSPDGRYIAYAAQPGLDIPASVFVRDLHTGTVRLASPAKNDAPLDGSVFHGEVSDDGTVVVFDSDARNIDSTGPALPPTGNPGPVSYLARFLVDVSPGDEAVYVRHWDISDLSFPGAGSMSTNSENPILVALADIDEGVFPQTLSVRSVHSGDVLAEFAVPGGMPEDGARFFKATATSGDGSTIVAQACVLDLGVTECHWYRADVETQTLVPLAALDGFHISSVVYLSRDGDIAYFQDFTLAEPYLGKVDLASGILSEVAIGEDLCDDALAAPASYRLCTAIPVGSGDNWFVLGGADRSGVEFPTTYRATAWLVNADTGVADELYSSAHGSAATVVAAADDGSKVLYGISNDLDGPGVYLWQRDSPAGPERIDVLPDGTFPPAVPVPPLNCPGGAAAMTPDGRFVAYTARPEPNAFPSVFLRDLDTGEITLMSPAVEDEALNGCVSDVVLSDDGQTVSFVSLATNIDSEGPALDGLGPALFVSQLGEPTEEPPAAFRLILPGIASQLAWP